MFRKHLFPILTSVAITLFAIASLLVYSQYSTIVGLGNASLREMVIWEEIRRKVFFLIDYSSELGENRNEMRAQVQDEIKQLLTEQQETVQAVQTRIIELKRQPFVGWLKGHELDIIGNKIVEENLIKLVNSVAGASGTLLDAGPFVFDPVQLLSLRNQQGLGPVAERSRLLYAWQKWAGDTIIMVLLPFLVLVLAGLWVVWLKMVRPAIRTAFDSEADLTTIMNALADGVLKVGPDERVTHANPMAKRIIEHDGDSLIGLHSHEMFPGATPDMQTIQQDLVERVCHSLKTGEQGVVSQVRVAILLRSGRNIELTYSARPIFDNHGEFAGLVVVFRDSTAENLMRDQFLRAEKLKALGQLVGGIAHDFNNLLAGISGATEVVRHVEQGNITKRSQKLLDGILRQVMRGSDLTQKLTDFSRKSTIDRSVVNLASIAEDAVEVVCKTVGRNRQITFENHARFYQVLGSEGLLQSAIMNLCINAVHAIDDDGQVKIILRNSTLGANQRDKWSAFDVKPGKFIDLLVIDDGAGISSEDLPHIFDPFFSTKPVGAGSGMGLSAVYGVVLEHQGIITVDSRKGRGACFCMRLPIAKEAVANNKQEPLGPPKVKIDWPQYHQKTALVVDDEEIQRETYAQMLVALGFEVMQAGDGEGALQIVENAKSKPDLIIMDVNMPKMNGVNAFARMQKVIDTDRIIIVTGHSKVAHRTVLSRMGARHWLKKPFRFESLEQVIGQIMHNGRNKKNSPGSNSSPKPMSSKDASSSRRKTKRRKTTTAPHKVRTKPDDTEQSRAVDENRSAL